MMATFRRSISSSRNQSAGPFGARDAVRLRCNIVTGRPDATTVARHKVNPAFQHAGSAFKGIGPLTEDRIEGFRPNRPIIHIFQRDGHLLARAVDRDVTEKLQSIAWRQILALLLARGFHIFELRAEGFVERVWTKCAGMNRPADKLPEWFKVLKCSFIWIVVV